MKYKNLILLAAIIISIQCKNSNNIKERNIMKEIPTYSSGDPELFYKLAKQKAEQLKLDNIDNGFDGIQIRIWYDYALVFNRDLVVFKYENNIWTGTHYYLMVNWDYKKLTETIKSSKRTALNPKSGWDDFINKLFLQKIDTLPHMTSIPGLDLGTDGITYNIEYSNKEKYRFYGYYLPQNYQEKAWQAKNMVNILKLIEKEFGIKPGF